MAASQDSSEVFLWNEEPGSTPSTSQKTGESRWQRLEDSRNRWVYGDFRQALPFRIASGLPLAGCGVELHQACSF
jgi:hypothetical protein